jgi:nondiscriminating aspartyl-tRNA synthetase
MKLMERTLIGDLRGKIGQSVTVKGWLQVLRDQKKMQFLVLRDQTGSVQIVVEKAASPDQAALITSCNMEAALSIIGKVIDNPIVKLGGIEMQLESIIIDNNAASPLPYEPFGETQPALDFRMDWRFLDLRRPENLLVFKVQTTAEMAMRDFWIQNNFIEIHSPKLVNSPSESGAELFTLDYFDRKAYLAQSPQFFKQMAMAAGFERVFEIGPVFRADPSFTSRHMTEFTGVDMEISWIESHEDVMAFQERLLQHTYQKVKDIHGEEIKSLLGFDLVVPTVPFPRLTMAEALVVLKDHNYIVPADKKGDIDPGGERLIAQYIKEKFGHDFVFLIDWPISVRPFYHMRYADNPKLTKSFDLIASGLEITTGAQREHRYDVLVKQAEEKGLHLEPIQSYMNSFKYGCPSHGGFGLGLSRLLMVMLNLGNIRDGVFLFRGPNRLDP